VNLLLVNDGTRHRFGLTAVPPAALAAPVDLRGDVVIPRLPSCRTRKAASMRGSTYRCRASEIMAAAAVRAAQRPRRVAPWMESAASEPTDVTVDVELDDVRTRLKSSLPELDLNI
jgi:hypothetical protein